MGLRKVVTGETNDCHPSEQTGFFGRKILGPTGYCEVKFYDDGTVQRFCTQAHSGVCKLTEGKCIKGDTTLNSAESQNHSAEYNLAIGSRIKLDRADLLKLDWIIYEATITVGAVPAPFTPDDSPDDCIFRVVGVRELMPNRRIYNLEREDGSDQTHFMMHVVPNERGGQRFSTLEVLS